MVGGDGSETVIVVVIFDGLVEAQVLCDHHTLDLVLVQSEAALPQRLEAARVLYLVEGLELECGRHRGADVPHLVKTGYDTLRDAIQEQEQTDIVGLDTRGSGDGLENEVHRNGAHLQLTADTAVESITNGDEVERVEEHRTCEVTDTVIDDNIVNFELLVGGTKGFDGDTASGHTTATAGAPTATSAMVASTEWHDMRGGLGFGALPTRRAERHEPLPSSRLMFVGPRDRFGGFSSQ